MLSCGPHKHTFKSPYIFFYFFRRIQPAQAGCDGNGQRIVGEIWSFTVRTRALSIYDRRKQTSSNPDTVPPSAVSVRRAFGDATVCVAGGISQ